MPIKYFAENLDTACLRLSKVSMYVTIDFSERKDFPHRH